MLTLLLACTRLAGDEGPDATASDTGPDCERVEGWLDNDGDGYGRETETACEAQWYWVDQGGDCNDLDELINPDAFEICEPWARGVDEDCDGLLDCEDRDCEAACTEDCTDGWDQDDDGLVDCEDDDCLGTAACDDFSVWITGGGPVTVTRYSNSMQLFASSIEGQVQFSGGLGSCSFLVNRVEMWTYSGITTDVRREGLWPGEGCASSISMGFLPRTSEITFSGRTPSVPQGGWYGMNLSSSVAGYSTVVYRGTLTGGVAFSR